MDGKHFIAWVWVSEILTIVNKIRESKLRLLTSAIVSIILKLTAPLSFYRSVEFLEFNDWNDRMSLIADLSIGCGWVVLKNADDYWQKCQWTVLYDVCAYEIYGRPLTNDGTKVCQRTILLALLYKFLFWLLLLLFMIDFKHSNLALNLNFQHRIQILRHEVS